MEELREYTNEVLYENYRSNKLIASGNEFGDGGKYVLYIYKL